jgi:peptide/nickel transport system substrate-binding protein
MIVSPALLAKGGEAPATSPVGTGPYKLVEWSKDRQLVMERYAEYWGDKPAVAKVTFKPVPEESTRVTLIKTGEADIATNLSPDQIKALKSAQNVKTITVPTGLVVVAEMYVREKDKAVAEPLFDKRVREAINLAIDRKSIVEGILDNAATLIPNPIPPLFAGYNDAVKPYPYDPQRAKELMAQAGYGGGFSWSFRYPTGGRYVGDDRISQLLQQNWEAIGIKTQLVPMEWPNFVATRNQRAPIDMGGWAGRGAFEAEFSLFPIYASGTDDQLVTGIPQLEAVLKQARTELDDAKRADLYKQAQQIIRDEHAAVVFHQQHNIYAVSARMDWAGRADEGIYVSEMAVK